MMLTAGGPGGQLGMVGVSDWAVGTEGEGCWRQQEKRPAGKGLVSMECS